VVFYQAYSLLTQAAFNYSASVDVYSIYVS